MVAKKQLPKSNPAKKQVKGTTKNKLHIPDKPIPREIMKETKKGRGPKGSGEVPLTVVTLMNTGMFILFFTFVNPVGLPAPHPSLLNNLPSKINDEKFQNWLRFIYRQAVEQGAEFASKAFFFAEFFQRNTPSDQVVWAYCAVRWLLQSWGIIRRDKKRLSTKDSQLIMSYVWPLVECFPDVQAHMKAVGKIGEASLAAWKEAQRREGQVEYGRLKTRLNATASIKPKLIAEIEKHIKLDLK